MPSNPATWGIQKVTTELKILQPTVIKLNPAIHDTAATYTLIDYSGTTLDLQGYSDAASLVAARVSVDSSATLFDVGSVSVDPVAQKIQVTLVVR